MPRLVHSVEETKLVWNRFVSELFWTFISFPSQGAVNKTGHPYMDGETGRGEGFIKSQLNLRSV